MNNKIRRSIAVTLTAAAICNPVGLTNVFSAAGNTPVIASADNAGQEITSGKHSRYDGYYYDEYEGVGLNLSMNDKGIVITGCYTKKPNATVRIPKQLYGKDVVAIGPHAFEGQTNITMVQFFGCNEPLYTTNYYPGGGSSYGPRYFKGGSSISEIGEGAFEGCTNLKSVTVGDKELTVGDSAFSECTNLSYIDFYNASNNHVAPVFGDIGESAFYKSGISCFGDWSEQATCKKIGDWAFTKCNNLKEVNFKATEMEEYCFASNPKLTEAAIDIPNLGAYAFYKCSALETATFSNIKKIGQHAFDSCTSLKTASIPKSIESIGEFAFLYDSKLSTPALFVKDNGQSLNIGRFAYYGTAVEYVALSGNIKVNDHAFKKCNLKKAVVEGNVTLGTRAIGFDDAGKKVSGFTIYGNTSTNSYASSYGIPYVKVNTSKSYDNIMNELKPYFMRLNATQFGNANGCCAGAALAQVFTYTNKKSFSDFFPTKYNGKTITSFLDVPEDAYSANRPEFSNYISAVYNYWKDQNYYLFYNTRSNYEITLTPETIDGYAKLTEYGIVLPAVLHVKNHNHAVSLFGVEKLKTPMKITDDISHTEKTYGYRLIISENGYGFKEQNGKLVAKGCDHFTWWPGCRPEEGWIPVEDTYIYVSTSNGSAGHTYQQRWDKGKNVKSGAKTSTLNDLDFLLASNIGEGKK
ncbi:MAG: leucine-rich repeat domain-containing protein [Ruminococcus sp.]|nr:leucine-rich repeat domain-containing protein [Ruminococcus sp.]